MLSSNGNLVSQIESGSIRNFEIIIPQSVFDELQSQASKKKEQGFIGLEKIRKSQITIWQLWAERNCIWFTSFV